MKDNITLIAAEKPAPVTGLHPAVRDFIDALAIRMADEHYDAQHNNTWGGGNP